MRYRPDKLLLAALIVPLMVFYALGINPWIMPESTDDIMYYEGAKALIHEGAYTYNGRIISDWPPVYSLVLAGCFILFGESLVVAKVVSAVCAIISLILGYRLLRNEQRRNAWWIMAVYAVLPTCFLCAVRSSADWLFVALSLSLLLGLQHLQTKRSVWLAVTLGVALGAAALTRHVGVMLGAAVAAQAIRLIWLAVREKNSLVSAALRVWPEVIVATLGASLWLGWGMFLKLMPERHVAPGLYEAHGATLMSNFQPLDFFGAASDFFAQVPNILEKFGIGETHPLALTLGGLLGMVVLLGWFKSVWSDRCFRASDWFVAAYMILIACYEWKLPRFLIPIGPWLIIYFLEGFTVLSTATFRLLSREASSPEKGLARMCQRYQTPAFAAVWLLAAVIGNGLLVFKGHPGGLHGPLMASRAVSQEEFYGPFYRDLLQAGQALTKLPEPRRIGTEGFYANYLQAFSGLPCLDARLYPALNPNIFVRIEDHHEGYELQGKGWHPIFTAGRVTILTNEPTPLQAELTHVEVTPLRSHATD